MAVAREKSRLVPINAIPKGRPTSFENATIETSSVITVGIIRPMSTMLVISSFSPSVRELQFHGANMPLFQFDMLVALLCHRI